MAAGFSFEKTCSKIASMGKREVIRRLLNFDGPIKMDFSADYLEKLSTDRLRHILLAAFVTINRKVYKSRPSFRRTTTTIRRKRAL
ncbi:MAG: hypothetical protein ACYSOJ_01960 [Planctomycetota bacterium]|jgi:hypothetical protein